MTRKEWGCLNRQGAKGAKSFISEPLRREGRKGFFVGFVMILEEGSRIIIYQALKGGKALCLLKCYVISLSKLPCLLNSLSGSDLSNSLI